MIIPSLSFQGAGLIVSGNSRKLFRHFMPLIGAGIQTVIDCPRMIVGEVIVGGVYSTLFVIRIHFPATSMSAAPASQLRSYRLRFTRRNEANRLNHCASKLVYPRNVTITES